MTVLAAYLPGKGGRATLDLAAQLARGLGVPLSVATVLPGPWDATTPATVDAQLEGWSAVLAASAESSARAHLARTAPGAEVRFLARPGRSVPATLVDLAAGTGAAALVLGSSPRGRPGQVVVGSTAGRLLHSSPLSVALAPRGHRGGGAGTPRVTCAAAGEDGEVVARARRFADRVGARLRVLTLAVRGPAPWAPAVSVLGPRAEEEVLDAWTEQAHRSLRVLSEEGALPPEAETAVGAGQGWREALDAVDWEPGELLVVGSRPHGPVARVFLGSRATRILRHAPVPVVVLPG
ncbi:universal stress protein [Kineococcus radiotolerans]|uniref:UspA domain protein n=1 Tax=Kineococcus radiotolerans (strain ATCC BAA-149 / DSM 14245 / SRS30216) TaxID=266940 RepID=A6W7A3_KINRD|nr:universal stress protein [Kineococcus radiotolerans]ABS02692.1 UspA domain protein [Kineococcus radiotolerans SRS30216 = ATCC BAA-149]